MNLQQAPMYKSGSSLLAWPMMPWFGIACVLVWNQCILYNQRIGVDAGFTTVLTSGIRCVFMLVLLGIALSPLLKGKLPHWWEVASVACMSCSGIALLASNLTASPLPYWICIICSAVGITWGGGMWIQLYVRFDLRCVFACSTIAMAVSAVAGIVVCYLPWQIASCLGVILPVVSYTCYLRSMDAVDKEAVGESAKVPANAKRNPVNRESLRLFAGIAAFSVALGITRGYPDGSTLLIPEVLRPAQFVVVIAACIIFYSWSMRPSARPKAGTLWACYIALLSLSVFLVSATTNSMLAGSGAALLSAINLLQVLMLWLLACDTAKHSARPAFVSLAAFWFVHLFFREFGRALVIVFPAQAYEAQMALLAVVVCLLAVSIALLLAGRTPTGALFFSDFGELSEHASSSVSSEAIVERTNQTPADSTCTVPIRMDVDAATMAPAVRSEADAAWLRDAYGLTQRECEVAALLALNKSAASIGSQLFLSKETVRSYTKAIYAKMDVHSKEQLAQLMAQHR